MSIADGFIEPHEKQEQADYDHDAVFTRPDTRGLLALGQTTVDLVSAADSASAAQFFGPIAMQARIHGR